MKVYVVSGEYYRVRINAVGILCRERGLFWGE